jgi:hypothetical protein
MKYKFKTDYVYIYYTDDKGTQGKIAYKKGDIVDVFSPLGGNPFSGANVLVEVTPFKAYDVMNKAYKTIRKISIRTAFLEAVNEYQQGRPDVIDKGIKKYKITRDYDARFIFTDKATEVRPPKRFYKGDVVDAITYQGKIVSGNYDITPVAELYDNTTPSTDSNIKKYKVIKEVNAGSGYLDDGREMIPIQFLVPKVGDIIYGEITDGMVFNKNIRGIRYTIETKKGGIGGTTIIIIPEENLQVISEEIKSDIKNEPQPESKQSKIFTTNNILIGLAAIAVIGMGYYIIKK